MDKQPGGLPDPGSADDLAEFIGLLGELRAWAGSPSYRSLAQRVGPLMRPPRTVSPFTVVDAFKTERRRLDLDLVVAIVRALGADEPTVGRWRETCIKVHSLAKTGGPVGVFRQLPSDLATFTGRREELSRLIAAAKQHRDADHPNTVVISAIEGMAGVGKTQLAIHIAHELVRAGHFADIQLHVNLRGFDPELPPADPSAVLEAFLRQLGVPAQQIPASQDERAGMYRDRLRDRNALILLDNAADEEQVRDLFPASPSCLVLVTSRRSLAGIEGADLCRLDVFTSDEAIAMLARIVGPDRVEAERPIAEQIVQACGHVPLAISIAAARLRSRPAWKLADLARLLRGGVGALAFGGRALTPVFDLSYLGLPKPARRLFRLCGWHPGDDFTADSAAAAAGCAVEEAEQLLELLLDEHLLQQRESGRYEFHDLVRAYARGLAEPEQSALARVATWYVLTAQDANHLLEQPPIEAEIEQTYGVESLSLTTYEEALAWFDIEYGNLRAVIDTAAEHKLYALVWRLAASLHSLRGLRYRMTEYTRFVELGLDSARIAGDPLGEAWMLHGLARASRDEERLEETESYLLQIIELCRLNQAPAMMWRQTVALNNLSVVYNILRRYDDAVASLEEALRICPEDRRTRMECSMVSNIAAAHFYRGDHAKAVEFFRHAQALYQQAGDRRGVVASWGDIGLSSLRLADHDGAFEAFTTYLKGAREIDSLVFQGLAHLGLGDTLADTNRIGEARAAWKEAESILAGIGHRNAEVARERLATGRVEPYTVS
ncbi:ATP-binding protein [Streptacidiphilus anmyonensis]|uniref:ATP-binding protein n=1 Tax=Streptacidiphilus anmyonensis TaxID=405782 RepID=UPI000693DDDB|nr:tetratricopeptide repeat protein [Streptacidiphilus anmyonensis]